LIKTNWLSSIHPDITTLQNTKPRNFDEIVLHITVDSDKKVLDKKLRSILLGAKWGVKVIFWVQKVFIWVENTPASPLFISTW
jgi:uncharacterized protein with PhoU and TrkA domain